MASRLRIGANARGLPKLPGANIFRDIRELPIIRKIAYAECGQNSSETAKNRHVFQTFFHQGRAVLVSPPCCIWGKKRESFAKKTVTVLENDENSKSHPTFPMTVNYFVSLGFFGKILASF
jgi:hypothetical protein